MPRPAGNAPPSVTLTSPESGASFIAPTVEATASNTDGTVARVDVYANGALVGSDNIGPYSYTWSGVATGGGVGTSGTEPASTTETPPVSTDTPPVIIVDDPREENNEES